ncbi:MAG: hypothetical protein CMN30_34445 [Sandaracinus sp.]|nr:hypothetical protein [Sandaracinus sp.]
MEPLVMHEEPSRADQERAEALLQRAMETLGERAFGADADAIAALAPDARPAVESLDMALRLDTAADIRALGHHESLAMFALLGRRAASLDVSVPVAHHLAPAILDAFDAVAPTVREGLELACLEGYVRGREERVREVHAQRAAEALPSGELVEGIRLLSLAGDHEAEVLTARIEEFGRELMRTDARACVVDLSALLDPDLRRAAAVASADETARMLGVVCAYAGVNAAWREAFAEAGIAPDHDGFHEALGAAVRAALKAAGLTLHRPGPLGRLLRRRATDR